MSESSAGGVTAPALSRIALSSARISRRISFCRRISPARASVLTEEPAAAVVEETDDGGALRLASRRASKLYLAAKSS
jgi:hypothetical protein